MKKTAWFPAHIKPVHKGVYQIRTESGSCYSQWDGEKWCCMHRDKDVAARQWLVSWCQDYAWRGLTEKAT
jgi:hypothetical protein